MRISVAFDREKGAFDRKKGAFDREKGAFDRAKAAFDRAKRAFASWHTNKKTKTNSQILFADTQLFLCYSLKNSCVNSQKCE
jgi:hypothetical protein